MCPVLTWHPCDKCAIAVAARASMASIARAAVRRRRAVDAAIERLVRDGQLIRLHRGVYAVGHRAIGEKGRAMAAVLACGPGAVLAGLWAAALWGLCRWPRGDVEVIAAGKRPEGDQGPAGAL